MDGVFMKKMVRLIGLLLLLCALFYLASLAKDKQVLSQNLIRLHVIANSDDPSDQQTKLSVKDQIVAFIQANLPEPCDITEAKAYLTELLPEIQKVANDALKKNGSNLQARVSLTNETFDIRHYDTFSLPSGVYQSLRVELGEGKGKNWWCVVFPSLCIPVNNEDFKDTAVAAGFDQQLADTISNERTYKIRFFLLDCIGKIENFFSFS